ncbi:MAG TPA: DUF5916 domain-containing protein, partial [Haliangium sp.]|nr:DUF5916 domain-containing protein [Haliangium sp.]
ALTAPARAEYLARYDDGTEQRGRALVDPLTSYNVLRLQQELGASGSYLGSTLTGVARALGDDPLAQAMARQAMTGGVDWLLRLEGGAYLLDGYLGASLLRGEAAAITAIGQSSVHYLQRPDQDHVSEDLDATSLSGLAGRLGMAKLNGRWRGDVNASFETPGFDLNDVGQLQASDDLIWNGSLRRHQSEPGALVHEWMGGVASEGKWSFGGAREYLLGVLLGEAVWKNFWRTGGELALVGPGDSDSATRGGPLAGTGWTVDGALSLFSAAGSRTQWHTGVEAGWSQTGRRGMGLRGGLTLQPTDRLSVSLTPRYVRLSDNRQYIATIDEAGLAGNPETYGARYVFGTIDLRELAVQARVQVVFTPELALDLYAEPFASSGRFHGFGELPKPRSRGLTVYGRDQGTITRAMDADTYEVRVGGDVFGFDDPDFTALSFRSTAVLRWEFWPGSTLFAVWQVNRADDLGTPESVAPFGGPGAWTHAVGSPGTQTFALKLAYWWPAD